MEFEGSKDYSKNYSEESFWDKVKKILGKAGREILERSFTLYYCLLDKETPIWAKTVIIGALGYFVSPIDAIPDFIPGVGHIDDAAVLASAIISIAAHIKQEHREKAINQVDTILGK